MIFFAIAHIYITLKRINNDDNFDKNSVFDNVGVKVIFQRLSQYRVIKEGLIEHLFSFYIWLKKEQEEFLFKSLIKYYKK